MFPQFYVEYNSNIQFPWENCDTVENGLAYCSMYGAHVHPVDHFFTESLPCPVHLVSGSRPGPMVLIAFSPGPPLSSEMN